MGEILLKNEYVNLSIIDIVGEMDNGVAIIFNLLANNKDSYEVIFWYDRDRNIIIEPEEKLLIRLGVNDINEYDKISEMCFYFYSHIPNPDDVLKQYLEIGE